MPRREPPGLNRKPYPANPLWTLEELRNRRNPPFVPEPEFIRIDVASLGSDRRVASMRPNLSTQERPLKRWRIPKVDYPIPRLVSGLPWRFAQGITPPIVPDPAFVGLDLAQIGKR
jgi:hypothetical protein